MKIKRLGILSVARLVGAVYFLIATIFILPFALIISSLGLTDEFIPGFSFR
jgi:hypothetical protein